MPKDTLLIVTSKPDVHADIVIKRINSIGLGEKVVRFNTEDFATNCLLSYGKGISYLEFLDSNRRLLSKDILSVWYRRPRDFTIEPSLIKYSMFIKEQTEAAIKGFYFSTHFHSKWINPLDSLYKSRLKLQQLELADCVGFKVPPTIVTNSPKDLFDFLNKYDKISCKSLDYPNTKADGKLYPLLNRIVDKKTFKKNIDSIRYCPGLFQQYIEKKFDIRVIVLGKTLTAFAIYSQEAELSIQDVRGVSAFDLRHEVIELPKSIATKIISFTRQQGLVFSAIDLIYSANDEYYFLENNPNGQWFWLEEKTGFPLVDLFIKEFYNN